MTKEEIVQTIQDGNADDLDLTRADLTRADLRGADLTGANLSEADLRGAKLIGATIDSKYRDMLKDDRDFEKITFINL